MKKVLLLAGFVSGVSFTSMAATSLVVPSTSVVTKHVKYEKAKKPTDYQCVRFIGCGHDEYACGANAEEISATLTVLAEAYCGD